MRSVLTEKCDKTQCIFCPWAFLIDLIKYILAEIIPMFLILMIIKPLSNDGNDNDVAFLSALD